MPILMPFGNIIDPGIKQVPTGKLSIDWTQPMTRGLIGCWAPGSGSKTIDLVSGLTLGSYTSPAETMTPEGPAWGFVASAGAGNSANGTAFKTTPPLTIYCRIYVYAAPQEFYQPFCILGNAAGTNILGRLAVGPAANKQMIAQWTFGAGSTGSLAGTTNTLNFPEVSSWCTTIPGTGASVFLYKNGIQQLSGTAYGAAGPAPDSGAQIVMQPGIFYTALITLVYNFALSATQVLELEKAPYSFLVSQEREIPIITIPAPFKAAWSRGSNLPVLGTGTY